MATQESLPRVFARRAAPEPRRAALEPAAGAVRRDVHELHSDSHVTDVSSRLGGGEAIDLLDDSATLRLGTSILRAMITSGAGVPDHRSGAKRFAAWSRRYLMLVASADALVGGIAAAVLHQSATRCLGRTRYRCSALSASSFGQPRSRYVVGIAVIGSASASTSLVRSFEPACWSLWQARCRRDSWLSRPGR